VTFGGTAATNVTVVSSTQITAITPAHATGAVTVTITNPDGQSATIPAGSFTFVTPITFAQVKSFTPRSASSDSITYNTSQSPGDLNIVVVGWHDITSTIVSVQDSNRNTYQLGAPLMSSGKGATALSQAIYYASNVVGGTNTVTVTFNQAAYGADIRILEYKGVHTLDAFAGAAGTGTLANSGSAATSASSELIFGANTVTTVTSGPGTGFTSRIISADGEIAEDEIENAQGSYSATAPLTTSGGWIMQMLTFSN
jgi:hypothetical protein